MSNTGYDFDNNLMQYGLYGRRLPIVSCAVFLKRNT